VLRPAVGSKRLLCAFALVSSLVSCAPSTETELLDVYGISPDRIEPGHTVRVRGDGFPPGRDARVRITGVAHRPGREPRALSVELYGRAISSEHIEARLSDEALDELGGRATIEGHVEVLFDATGGAVVGRSPPVVLDLAPASSVRFPDELARRRTAIDLVTWFGVTLAEESADEPGLPIEAVREGSPAAETGLLAGDRLISLDGLRLHALSDFIAPPGAGRALLIVEREGEDAPFELRIALDPQSSPITPLAIRTGQAALAWLLAALLLVAPFASVVDRFAPKKRAPARGMLALVRHTLPIAARGVIALGFFGAIAVVDRVHGLHVPLETIALGALAARTCAAYLGRPAGEARRAQLAAVVRAFGAAALAAIAIAVCAATEGTTDLVALQSSQGDWPWEWTALRTPAGPFLAAMLLIGGAWQADGRRGVGRFAAVVDETVALVLAGVAAAALFGGWNTSAEHHAQVIGPALFAIKALVIWIAMKRLGARATKMRAWHVAAYGAMTALAVGLAALAILHPPPPPIETALAEVLTGALGAFVVWMIARRIVRGRPEDPAPAHPFL
jgi:hypothetical protein